MNMLKNLFAVFFAIVAVSKLHADITYSIINAVNKKVTLDVYSPVGNKIAANLDLEPGQVKTVTAPAANCLDGIWGDFHDGKGMQYLGAAICAGSVACITDEANYKHALAKPYHGQPTTSKPCNVNQAPALGVAALACTVRDAALEAGFCKGSAGTFGSERWKKN